MSQTDNKIRLLSYTGDGKESLVYDIKEYIDIPRDSAIIILTKTPTEYNTVSNENAMQDKDHIKYAFAYVDTNNVIHNYGRRIGVENQAASQNSPSVMNPMQENNPNITPAIPTSTVDLFDVTKEDGDPTHPSASSYHIKKLDTKELKNTEDSAIFQQDLLDFLKKTGMQIPFSQPSAAPLPSTTPGIPPASVPQPSPSVSNSMFKDKHIPKFSMPKFRGGSNKTKKHSSKNPSHNKTVKNLDNLRD
jgi:hypothetical protein